MPVASDAIEIRPGLEEARALAAEHSLVPLRHTFIADTETLAKLTTERGVEGMASTWVVSATV
jgi:hypothetical protein